MPESNGIVGEWIHAHEQDDGRTRVFVRGGSPLPPSRGRRRFTFRADGTFEDTHAGADDRLESSAGGYRLDGQQLTLAYSDKSLKPAAFRTSLNHDGTKLEILKLQN